jgi:hypothetical protein
MPAAIAAENTSQRWESVIKDLTGRQRAISDHTERLRAQKRDLVLDAALGSADAKKKLEKINAELTRSAFEVDEWNEAIVQAQVQLEAAGKAEAEAAIRARHKELAALALVAVHHARTYTAALKQAATAADVLKRVVENMKSVAAPEERQGLDHLLGTGPFMRAAEYAGLRHHIEFAAYPGPQSHVGAMEDELTAHLERWLTSADQKEDSNGNQHEK